MPMDSFSKILQLSAAQIKALIREDPDNEELYTALVLRKFMEKYHIVDTNTALEQFLLFKKAQGDLLSLNETEEKALAARLNKVKLNNNK